MKEVILEAAKMTDKASALEHIAQKLNFPDYFGKNFDALNDCLTDICEEGAQKARTLSAKTMRKVYKKVGFVQ